MIDPFAPAYAMPSTATEPQQALSLFELNSMVHAVLHHTMPDTYWLMAEISELRVASNGHCYLELVQKDDVSGSLVAKARANIWRQNYLTLSSHFVKATGQPLTSGIKVLVEVNINFHELYGYSLNICNIDPTYTLGDLAQRRKEIIRQLEEDGVIDLNKEIPLPRVIRRIAIISSKTAAGYGDFCKQLQQSAYAFHTKLFPATMQGEKVEQSIITALNQINAEQEQWDVAVIIRGGGATTDLSGFDSYLLAANIAQFPLPVLTGIGHERDDTVCDLVACKRLKTPTAVAAFLIDSRTDESATLHELIERLTAATAQRLTAEQHRVEATSTRLNHAAAMHLTILQQRFSSLAHRYDTAASRYTAQQRTCLLRLEANLNLHVHSYILKEQNRIASLAPRIQSSAESFFMHEHQRQKMINRSLTLAGPERILALGFTITLKGGQPVSDASLLRQGDTITTRFAHGEIESEVK